MSISEGFSGIGAIFSQLQGISAEQLTQQQLLHNYHPVYDHLQQLQQLAHTYAMAAPRDTGLEALKPRMSLLHAMDRKALAPHLTAALADDRPHPDLERDLQGVHGSGASRCECGAYLALDNYVGECESCHARTIDNYDSFYRAHCLRQANEFAQRTIDDPRPMGWRQW